MQVIAALNAKGEVFTGESRRSTTQLPAAEKSAAESAGSVPLATMNWSWSNLIAELCGTALWVGGLMVLPWLAVTAFTAAG